MQTGDFDYNLPQELIAQQPAAERTQARLMLVNRVTGEISHYHAADLPALLRKGDLMVLNNTRVIPARLFGRKQKTGGRMEVLFIEEGEVPRPDSASGQDCRAEAAEKNVWQVFLHSSGRPRVGDVFLLADDKAEARIISIGERGRAVIQLRCAGDFLKILEAEGLPPLPPYIKRPKNGRTPVSGRDSERYQTVYARVPGAIAAPTAGLHLSDGLLTALDEAGIQRTEVTLHVGPGTFLPVRCEKIENHKMESERFIIEPQSARKINDAIAEKRRIVAVGTTVVRTLESAATSGGLVAAQSGRTEIFIHPPYRFKIVNALLTNFHLPRSTLLMLVSAFAGKELIRHAYETAVREKYRFYSYGDCMLIV